MVRLVVEPVGDLTAYATVPSAFETRTVFQVTGEQGSWRLVEQPLEVPFLKDYDAVEPPLSWPRVFDASRWTVIAAQAGSARVGGALIAHDSAGIDLLEQRSDLAVIWDLRVALGSRRHGIGRMLLDSAERWSVARGCSELKVETQNTNVAACRLYARHGFRLASVCRGAYPQFPGRGPVDLAKAPARQLMCCVRQVLRLEQRQPTDTSSQCVEAAGPFTRSAVP